MSGSLGPLRVQVSGEDVRLGGPRPRLLFALLVVAGGRSVSMDRLTDDLYAEGVKRGLASLATKPRFCLLAADLGQLEADELPGVAQRHTVLEDEVSGTPNLVL